MSPKNYPTEVFPLRAMPSKTLWEWMRALWQTLSGVESTKLTPLHLPTKQLGSELWGFFSLRACYALHKR